MQKARVCVCLLLALVLLCPQGVSSATTTPPEEPVQTPVEAPTPPSGQIPLGNADSQNSLEIVDPEDIVIIPIEEEPIPEDMPAHYVIIATRDATLDQWVIPYEDETPDEQAQTEEGASDTQDPGQAQGDVQQSAPAEEAPPPTAEEAEAQANEAWEQDAKKNVSLLRYANAVDELGNPVEVRVFEDSGFNIMVAGTYEITFVATHPITLEDFYASCTIYVRTPQYLEALRLVQDGSSNARYRKYQKYRDLIQADLQARIDQVNEQFAQKVALIQSLFLDTQHLEYYRSTYAEQDAHIEESSEAFFDLVKMETPTIANWSQVLPVFVVISSMKVDEPLDLFNLRKLSLDGIEEVFWEMHEWSYVIEDGTLQLILTERSSEDMIAHFNMDAETVAKLEELMQPEFQMLFAALTQDSSFTAASEEYKEELRASLPEGLSVQREAVVLTAHSLVGQVPYFWGGKYNQIGWNPMWGVPRIVESPNSETFGSVRAYGLDCSGFAAWVFINAVNDTGVLDVLGSGTTLQWNHSTPLGWDEALPGDLAFKSAPGRSTTNHVGIVVEKRTDGSYLIAHCSSSKNAVVVSEAWESEFRYMRRPILYDDK